MTAETQALKSVPNITRSSNIVEELTTGRASATEFTKLETLGGNQSSRTVGANIKIINSGEELAPIKVAEIDGKKYVLDGHHRLEAATRTGAQLKYEVVKESEWSSYGYKSANEIKQTAAEVQAQQNKRNNKLVKQYAQGQ